MTRFAFLAILSIVSFGPCAGSAAAAQGEVAASSATREPNSGAFRVYPWLEGAVYQLRAAPGRVSDIALQPGETLLSVAAGDTLRWIVGESDSGSGGARQTHVLVKPSAAGLTTNILIGTDRRAYHLEAASNADGAMTGISWTYPADSLVALRGNAAPASPAVAPDVAVERLNFDYRIEGDSPPWRPVRAFDDGRQVFIQFPQSLGQGEAPPLFAIGESNRPELLNYRIRGRYYVVDRLFAAAELRLGGKRQQVVRIVRSSSGQSRGRGGR